MNELERFKHLLEYFVAHLDYVQNLSTNYNGYSEYIQPLVESKQFVAKGLGYKGHNIQKQVAQWDTYANGRMCVNINPAYGSYKTKNTYINWETTGINIIANWKKDRVIGLMLVDYDEEEGWSNQACKFSVEELGLYKETDDINSNLKALFNEFNRRKENVDMERKQKSNHEKYKGIIELLKLNSNIILTGAPGTGKTYMAKEIAEAMGAEWKMVQFHPSYDYTDFIEGIRPQEDKSFKRVDGVFKSFCKHALESKETIMDNFEEVWAKLVDYLSENEYIDVPLLSNPKLNIRVELNEFGTGLANRTYPNGEYKKDEWINGKSKFFSKEQLYNVYRGLKGVPQGGHDNYRRAIVNYLKEKMGLVEYNTTSNKTNKPFVFIIDEINRGEISKIFGELFFSIDPGYRGKDGLVDTQYQNMISEGDPFKEGFYVPENVYVIGTMNDIDRSVESMDFAMRRRFAWKEVTAAESYDAIITDYSKFTDAQKTEIKQRMTRLNAKIDDELGRAYQIGASYFLKLKGNDFETLWKNYLEGLLFEYFRGERDAKQKVEELHAEYNNE